MNNNDDKIMIATEIELPQELFLAMRDHVDRTKKSFDEVYAEAVTLFLNLNKIDAVISILEQQYKL